MRVACLGAGYFSVFHHEGWQRLPGISIVGVADTDIAKATATGLPAFGDLDVMLAAVGADIVDIATPPPSHLAAIRVALKYKPRAIICQKPFCNGLEQAREAVDLAAAAGVPLIVHENFRFQPWFRTMRAALDAGLIGVPLQAQFRLRTGDGQGADAYLARQPYFRQMPRLLIHETGVHYIDTFRYLFGAPTAVYADLRRCNPVIAGEDAGYIVFSHAGGMRSVFDGNRLLDHATKNPRLTFGEALVEGTKGTMRLEGDGRVSLRRFGEQDMETLLAPAEYQGFAGDCVFALQRHVVQALAGSGSLENEARDYLDVIVLEELIYRSADTGQRLAHDTQ
jgi:predicted dehydrogenase